jgi:hypothetical protein
MNTKENTSIFVKTKHNKLVLKKNFINGTLSTHFLNKRSLAIIINKPPVCEGSILFRGIWQKRHDSSFFYRYSNLSLVIGTITGNAARENLTSFCDVTS